MAEFAPETAQLGGWSFSHASCCGMPHHGARYTADDVSRYGREEGALCFVCGRLAEEVHHEPPGRHAFHMRTRWGTFVLKPALFALCRECHGARHAKLWRVEWEWNSTALCEAWWDGWLASHGYAAHSERLHELGKWMVLPG